jgi:hypothetical protein
MRKGKKRGVKRYAGRNGLVDPPEAKWFVAIMLAYLATVVPLIFILGTTATAFLATPLWAFYYFLFTRRIEGRAWDSSLTWRELLKLPRINFWNIIVIVLIIFTVQGVCGYLLSEYLESFRRDFIYSIPKDIGRGLDALTDDFQSTAVLIAGTIVSHFAGGFIAGVLPNKKGPSPYRHAIVGSLSVNFIGFTIALPLIVWSGLSDPPTRQDIGAIILASSPAYPIAAFGVWVAARTWGRDITGLTPRTAGEEKSRENLTSPTAPLPINRAGRRKLTKQKRLKIGKSSLDAVSQAPASTAAAIQTEDRQEMPKVKWSRRRIGTIAAGVVLLTGLIGFWAWVRSHRPTICASPPETATLDYWPVTYSSLAEDCHDYQSVDARLVGDQYNYSQSQEQWEQGLDAHAGNEIYVSVYINNGAADNAEELHPGQGIARNVRLTTEIDKEPSAVHYVKVRIVGDNTKTVINQFKINTEPQGRLELIPKSGQARNYNTEKVLADNLDVGNNTFLVGDLPPKFKDAVFIRFTLKVVN